MGNYSFYKSKYIEIITITDTKINFQEHSHADDFVITMITDGYAEFVLNLKPTHISKGEIIIASPYEAHSLVSEAAVSIISVCVKKQAIYDFDKTFFAECIDRVFTEIQLENATSNLLMSSVMCIYDKNHNRKIAESDDCENCRSGLEKYPEEGKRLSQLAEEAHFSKYHFIRHFKKISGLTPRKFLIQSRIRKAQHLLREGKNAADTAAAVGFYDQSHFDKYFKSIVGITPSEYVCSVSNFLQDKS